MKNMIGAIIIILSATFVLASGIEQKQKVEKTKAIKALTKRYTTSTSKEGIKCESKQYCELKWTTKNPLTHSTTEKD